MNPLLATLRILLIITTWGLAASVRAAPDGELHLAIIDSQTRQPIPVRIKLTNNRGRAIQVRDVGRAALGDFFYLDRSATLGLRRGDYLFDLDAGPEYRTQSGHFKIDRYADDAKSVEMRRFATLADEGWYAGDIDASRPARDLPIVAATEGIHYAASTAWTFDGTKWKRSHNTVARAVDLTDPYASGRHLSACLARVDLAGGSLLLVSDGLLEEPPIELDAGATSMQVVQRARAAGLRVVAATPTAWELPLWIASGELDAVVLLTRHSQLERATDNDPTGRPRDKSFYPGKQGLPRWGQDIYFRVLELGVQLSPLAGSGSGNNESPLGTNRAYAHLGGPFSAAAWWDAVASGKTVVTNGPLVRPSVGGDPPGSTFAVPAGQSVDFEIALSLASRQPVEYLKILKNGEVYQEVRLSDWAAQGGRLPPVSFDASGWFAIQADTGTTDKLQYALTAPYYVHSASGPRVSKQAVQFFLTWLDELATLDAALRSSTADEIATARQYFEQLLAAAGAP